MVNGIGGGGGAGRAAIEAALRNLQSKSKDTQGLNAEGLATPEAPSTEPSNFAEALRAGVEGIDDKVKRTESLHLEVLAGKLDIHEVAAQLKDSELTFEFALQVRNKLLDAYREVMRMTV